MSQATSPLNKPLDGVAPPSGTRTNPKPFLVAGGVALVVLVAIIAYAALGHSEKPRAETQSAIAVNGDSVVLQPNAPQWHYVELATAEQAPALVPLPAPGRVDFDEKRSASVGTPLPGRVERVLVRVGDRVKEGDRLFSVRSGALAEVERDVAAAQEAVTVKRRMADRTRELVSIKAAPEKDLLAAEAEVRDAELSLKAATAKRSSLKVNSEGENLFWVAAPRAGTVVDMDVFASQEVTPDHEKPLLRLSDLSEVLVLADIQENDAYDVKVGTKASIHTQAGNLVREGVVEHISEVVDPKRRTVEVRVRAKNADGLLRPNAFVEVTLESDPDAKRVRVPAEAVVTEGSRSMVFVEKAPNHLTRVPVTVGRQREGAVELRDGLPPGTRFVSRGAILLLNQIDLAD